MNLKTGQLRSALRVRLLDHMIRTVGTPTSRWKVLVADRAALRILAAAIHVNELVNEGVTIIEMLDMRREPLPRMPAIYFVTPSAESVQQLANESATQYKSFHLFFTGRLPDFQMQYLRNNAVLRSKLKSLVELNVQFLALESRLFSLDRPAASLPQLHAGDLSESREEMATISERLTEVCKVVAPGVPWSVRGDATSTVSRTVASLVKEQLETARLEPSFSSNAKREQVSSHEYDNDDDKPIKGTLLILDRVSDLTSPLLHEFSYQSMAHDLLNLDYRKPGGAHIEIEDDADPNKKKALQLDDEEKDPVWCNIRSMFIEEALKTVQDAFKEFLETDAAFKIRGKGTGDVAIKDMGAAVRALPDSQNRADKFAMHVKAARECLAACSSMRLADLALAEQDLVIGRAPDGTKVRAEDMVDRIIELLSDTAIPPVRRARLVMIALVVCAGLPGLGGEQSTLSLSSTFRPRLLRSKFDTIPDMDSTVSAGISGIRQLLTIAAENSDKLRAKHVRRPSDDEDTVTAKLKNKYANRRAQKRSDKANAARYRRHGLQEEGVLQYDVARYHPPLRSLVMDLIDDELDKDVFPTTGAVSVDSIIASMGATSLEEQYDRDDINKKQSKSSKSNVRNSSAAVAGLVKSFARGDSRRSGTSEDDDGRFRIAESGHLYIIFVVGGVCYSEVRAMYEVCAKREANVLIGGSQVLTPESYVDALAAVADPVVRIRVMLPPLPIELAQNRAARGHAMEVETEKHSNRGVSSKSESERNDGIRKGIEDGVEATSDEERPDVEVVVGYKKSRGLFGRKKR